MANGLTLTSVNNDNEKELEKVDEEHQDQELSCALDLDKKLPPNSRRHVSLFNLKSHFKKCIHFSPSQGRNPGPVAKITKHLSHR